MAPTGVVVLNGQLPYTLTGGGYISKLFFISHSRTCIGEKGQCNETEQRRVVLTMSAQFDSLKIFWLVFGS